MTEILAVDQAGAFWDDHSALVSCLREPIPRIPPWYGYDARGSDLFEDITRLPTYYLTRVERGLLDRHSGDIAEAIGGSRIAELGSGSAKKTRVLLQACVALRPTTYLPVDVSQEMLHLSASNLTSEFPGLDVTALWGRYEAGLDWLARNHHTEPLVVAFLGSNLGNFTAAERSALLSRISGTLRPGDGFLVSVDLLKPGQTFESCYNDPPGHDAFSDFRLNHLTHLNRRFGADFDLHHFVPRAHWQPAHDVVAGHLHVTEPHEVTLPELGVRLALEHGDVVNVGFSAKFDRAGLFRELADHGLTPQREWTDHDWAYSILLLRRDPVA